MAEQSLKDKKVEKNYKYMVATKCFTYNQALYIEDALHGFVLQETNFPVVYCIVDDASTDGERDILKSWVDNNLINEEGAELWREESYGKIAEAKYKGNPLSTFVIILLTENYHSQRKPKLPLLQKWTRKAKYEALCEGDDYWINPHKLQTQFNYMEVHPECSFCFHASYKLYNDGSCKEFSPRRVKEKYTPYDIILGRGSIMATNSIFYRSALTEDPLPKFWKESPIGDGPLKLFLIDKGECGFINEIMSIYRVHAQGSWTSRNALSNKKRNSHYKSLYKMFNDYNLYTNKKYNRIIILKKLSLCLFFILSNTKYFLKNRITMQKRT